MIKFALRLCAVVVALAMPPEFTFAAAPPPPSGGAPGQAPASVALPAAFVQSKLTLADAAMNLANPQTEFNATLTAPGGPLPNRTVTFWIDGQIVGEKLTASDGRAIFKFIQKTPLAAGNHVLKVLFEGDGQHARVEERAQLVVNKESTRTTVTDAYYTWRLVNIATGEYRWGLRISAKASSAAQQKDLDSRGKITVTVDGQPTAIEPDTDAAPGEFRGWLYLTPSSHSITVNYSGDAHYASSSVSLQSTAAPGPVPIPVQFSFRDGYGSPVQSGVPLAWNTPLTVRVYTGQFTLADRYGSPLPGVNVELRIFTRSGKTGAQETTTKYATSGADGYAQFTFTMPEFAQDYNLVARAAYSPSAPYLSCAVCSASSPTYKIKPYYAIQW